jgi:Mg/Co/Ni transporter MgtE
LPREEQNAPLLLFSAVPELVEYARGVYRQRSPVSGVLRRILDEYQKEGIVMPYTFEDFDVDYILRYFPELPREKQREVLERLPSELRQELFRSLPLERGQEMLQALSPKQRRELLQALPSEQRQELLQALPADERLAGLSAEQIRQYLEGLTTTEPVKPRKPRRKK